MKSFALRLHIKRPIHTAYFSAYELALLSRHYHLVPTTNKKCSRKKSFKKLDKQLINVANLYLDIIILSKNAVLVLGYVPIFGGKV